MSNIHLEFPKKQMSKSNLSWQFSPTSMGVASHLSAVVIYSIASHYQSPLPHSLAILAFYAASFQILALIVYGFSPVLRVVYKHLKLWAGRNLTTNEQHSI